MRRRRRLLNRVDGRGAGVAFAIGDPDKTHVGRILTKLKARDRAQLVVIAYETGLAL